MIKVMKKVLITGKQSYIGNAFSRFIADEKCDWLETTCISLREESWFESTWKEYDSVLHVAGLAHVDVNHADAQTKEKYYEINTELTRKAARKAREDGVRQFIYLSSVIVYGESQKIGDARGITRETKPKPRGFYGDSKLQAEEALKALETPEFKVLIIRLPMIYGAFSKGNFPRLRKIAEITRVFPNIRNSRSMLYIENLCELLKQVVEKELTGTLYPQDGEPVCTSQMVKIIGNTKGHVIWLVPGFTVGLKILSAFTPYVNKIFGNMYYEPEISIIPGIDYQKYTMEAAIERIVGDNNNAMF